MATHRQQHRQRPRKVVPASSITEPMPDLTQADWDELKAKCDRSLAYCTCEVGPRHLVTTIHAVDANIDDSINMHFYVDDLEGKITIMAITGLAEKKETTE